MSSIIKLKRNKRKEAMAIISGCHPLWLTRQAVLHYAHSENQRKPIHRAEHREQFVEYAAQALPSLGLERFLSEFREKLRLLHFQNVSTLDP